MEVKDGRRKAIRCTEHGGLDFENGIMFCEHAGSKAKRPNDIVVREPGVYPPPVRRLVARHPLKALLLLVAGQASSGPATALRTWPACPPHASRRSHLLVSSLPAFEG